MVPVCIRASLAVGRLQPGTAFLQSQQAGRLRKGAVVGGEMESLPEQCLQHDAQVGIACPCGDFGFDIVTVALQPRRAADDFVFGMLYAIETRDCMECA